MTTTVNSPEYFAERRQGLLAEADTLTKTRTDGLSGDDLARFEEIGEQLEALARQEAAVARVTAAANRTGMREAGADQFDDGSRRPSGDRVTNTRAAALTAIEKASEVPDFGRERATRLVEKDRTGMAARWALAASNPDYERAWGSLLVDPERGHLSWTEAERNAWADAQSVHRAMSVGTTTAGGFMVPLTLDPSIVLTSAGSAGNPVRELARKVTTLTNTWNGVTSAGVSASWDAELEEVSDDTPTLARPEIPVHKLAIFVPFSIEAEQDIPGLIEELRAIMLDERDVKEALAFTTGSGVGEPQGFVTALDGTASEVAPTTAETYAAADIYKTLEALPARHRANAVWQASLPAIGLTRQFDTQGGASLIAQLGEASPPTLLGKRLVENSFMDGTIDPGATADNFLLAVGNWSRYVVVDRVGATAEVVPHIFGAAGRPTGARGLYFYCRVGGEVIDINAFRMLNVATTA